MTTQTTTLPLPVRQAVVDALLAIIHRGNVDSLEVACRVGLRPGYSTAAHTLMIFLHQRMPADLAQGVEPLAIAGLADLSDVALRGYDVANKADRGGQGYEAALANYNAALAAFAEQHPDLNPGDCWATASDDDATAAIDALVDAVIAAYRASATQP